MEVPDEVPCSAVVGTVDIVDVVAINDDPTLFGEDLQNDPLATGPKCWKLENPVAFDDPIPASGRQMLWDFPVQNSPAEHRSEGTVAG